mgnify:CR=1 FL=1
MLLLLLLLDRPLVMSRYGAKWPNTALTTATLKWRIRRPWHWRNNDGGFAATGARVSGWPPAAYNLG